MTEESKHLTRSESLKPSVLDYVAQAGLNSLFDPIVRRLVDRLANRYKQLTTFRKWFDEYYTVANCLLQYYYLKKHSATLSEKFYGLQRVPAHGGFKLGKKELLLSVLAEAVFPYFLTKLRNSTDRIIFDELPRTHQEGKIMFMKCVIYLNNGVNILNCLCTFIQLLRYLGERTNYISPAHWFARVNLVYSNEELFEEVGFKNIVPNFIAKSVELFAFIAQFLHLWKENDVGNFNVVPIPPPPKKSAKAVSLTNECPLCHRPRKIETVLTVSGFVFCFECITKFLTEYNHCPVTKLPANSDHLVRIRATD